MTERTARVVAGIAMLIAACSWTGAAVLRHDAQAAVETRAATVADPTPPTTDPLPPLPVPADFQLTPHDQLRINRARNQGDAIPTVEAEQRPPTLILYDSQGPYGYLGEVYAQQMANLVSQFSDWEALPAADYESGDHARYGAIIYVGALEGEMLSEALLHDVRVDAEKVLWIGPNLDQLADPDQLLDLFGFTCDGQLSDPVVVVRYKRAQLTRSGENTNALASCRVPSAANGDRVDGSARVVAEGATAEGVTAPWAVTTADNRFTYTIEAPFSWVDVDDRYLVIADLLFDFFAPETPERHRAMVRLEDVGPNYDPAQLMAIATILAERNIPYAVAVYSRYEDPNGQFSADGRPEAFELADRPDVVRALQYMQANGATLIMHGHTHQYSDLANPYDGVSGGDFEFYLAHVDEADDVIYDGPLPNSSPAWAIDRIGRARTALAEAGLPQPRVFEFPHYAGSVPDYVAVDQEFGHRYDRGTYPINLFNDQAPDYSYLNGQHFPYVVRDLYGSVIIPENVGNVVEASYNNHPVRLPSDIIATAERNLVVRDGFASMFYHPFLGPDMLAETIDGITALGYEWVSIDDVLASP